jgi:hypothetical protein
VVGIGLAVLLHSSSGSKNTASTTATSTTTARSQTTQPPRAPSPGLYNGGTLAAGAATLLTANQLGATVSGGTAPYTITSVSSAPGVSWHGGGTVRVRPPWWTSGSKRFVVNLSDSAGQSVVVRVNYDVDPGGYADLQRGVPVRLDRLCKPQVFPAIRRAAGLSVLPGVQCALRAPGMDVDFIAFPSNALMESTFVRHWNWSNTGARCGQRDGGNRWSTNGGNPPYRGEYGCSGRFMWWSDKKYRMWGVFECVDGVTPSQRGGIWAHLVVG